MKKLQACDRPNEMIEKATNNYVIDLSTAGFEAFRKILLKNIHLSETVRRSRHYEHEVKPEQGDSIVQDVLRINSWQALRSTLSKGRTGSLSVVINMYRTTSRVLVNGRDSSAIASAINALLTEINSHPEVKAGNDYFKATLDPPKFKSKQNTKAQQKPTSAVALDNTSDRQKTPKSQNSKRTIQNTPILQFKSDQIKENGEKSNYSDRTHSSVTLSNVSDRQKTPKPQNSIRTIQNTPILQFKSDQIKENGEKSNYSDRTHSSVTLSNVSDRQKTPKPQNSIRTIQNTPISRLKRDQIKENREKSNYSDLRKKAPQKMTQTQVTQRQDITGEPNDNHENTIPETDTSMHEDRDGSNICPVCSESVGADRLVCKICNECLHAACEEVVAESNVAEYTCRTCLTVREADHLHSSPGRVPPGQPNGNDGTPEAEPSPCST